MISLMPTNGSAIFKIKDQIEKLSKVIAFRNNEILYKQYAEMWSW